MGKNFSGNNTGNNRSKSDFYQTPYSITEQLLENEKFGYDKDVLEPAFGSGAIVDILSKYFNEIDLIYYDKDFDFFNETTKYDYVITNPPFSLAFEFIQKSKEIAKEKFAMLLPLSYLHGQKRYESEIFRDKDYPLTKVYIFTRYPLLEETIREDGKYKTGMLVYAWFIWENNKYLNEKYGIEKLNPIIKWIDNNKYVLNGKYEKKIRNKGFFNTLF